MTADTARFVLAVMATAGMYTGSGQWLCEVGLPAKSGIGGGIVTVAPGKGGMGTYSPRLDAHGNSVRGGLAARVLSEELGLDLFASAPSPRYAGAIGGGRRSPRCRVVEVTDPRPYAHLG